MKTGRIFLLLGLLLTGLIIYLNKCRTGKSDLTPINKNAPPPLLVNGIVVSTMEIEDKIYASGTLIANEEVEIRNEIPGKITGIFFKEGTRVKKGDLIITLYDDDLLAKLKKLQLQKDIAQKTEERQKDLLTVNGVSQQDYELAQNELFTINAEIELVQSDLSKTRITAPFDGIVGLKAVSPGAVLPANTRIATIQALDPVKLEFFLPERYRSLISDNTYIQFTTESTEGMFSGKIYAFEPKIDLNTRSVMVRAECPNKDLKLIPGAFANIEIPLKKIERAILIPTQAIIPELKGKKVFIAKGGKAEKVSVETGMRNDSAVQITSGLQVGDTVLITGIMQMRPGLPLNINIKSNTHTR